MKQTTSVIEKVTLRLRGYLWQSILEEHKLRQVEEWLLEETSIYISRQYVSLLVKSKLWRETRAEEVLSEWIANGHLNYNLLALFFRLLRAHHCNDLLRRLASEAGKAYPFSAVHMHVCLPSSSQGSYDEALSESDLETCRHFVSAPRSEAQWRCLVKLNPRAAHRLLCIFLRAAEGQREGIVREDRDTAPHLPAPRVVNIIYDELLSIASESKEHGWLQELFDDLKRYLLSMNRGNKWNFAVTMKTCPLQLISWKKENIDSDIRCSNYYPDEKRRERIVLHSTDERESIRLPDNLRAHISRGQARRLPRDTLMAFARADPIWQTYLPYSDRVTLWNELCDLSRPDSLIRLLPKRLLEQFPVSIREAEILKVLDTTSIEKNPKEVFDLISLLSFDKALDFLRPHFHNVDTKVRQRVYKTLGYVTATQKVDPFSFLELCQKCINEQDPVRKALFEALSMIDSNSFTDRHLNELCQLLFHASEQTDLSSTTAGFIQDVLNKLFARRPREVLSLQTAFSATGRFRNIPTVGPELLPDKCLMILDEWLVDKILGHHRDIKTMIDAVIYTCNVKQLSRLLRSTDWYLTQQSIDYVPTIYVMKIVTSWKYLNTSERDSRMQNLINLHPQVLSNTLIFRWAVKNCPSKIGAHFSDGARKGWCGSYPTSLLVSLPGDVQIIFASFCRDVLARTLASSTPYLGSASILLQMRQILCLHPQVYIEAMDAYRSHLPSICETAMSDPASYDEIMHMSEVLLLALVNCDDPWKAAQAILHSMKDDESHPCRSALPPVLARLSPQRQSKILDSYKCLNPSRRGHDGILHRPTPEETSACEVDTSDASRVHRKSAAKVPAKRPCLCDFCGAELFRLDNIDEYTQLVAHCSLAVPEVQTLNSELLDKGVRLSEQEIRYLSRHCPEDNRFWDDIVFRVFTCPPPHGNYSLLRRILRIAPHNVRLARRTEAVQSWLCQLGNGMGVENKLIGALINLARQYNETFLDVDWYLANRVRFYLLLLARSGYGDAPNALLRLLMTKKVPCDENGGPVTLEACNCITREEDWPQADLLLTDFVESLMSLAEARNDPSILISIANFVSGYRARGLWQDFAFREMPTALNDLVFLGWYNHLKDTQNESFGWQATVLAGVRTSTLLHEVFTSRSYDLRAGVSLWATRLHDIRCNALHLGRLLSNDSEPSHRFLAYKMLIYLTAIVPSARKLAAEIEASFPV